jgi:hypothetical protein
MPLHHQIWDLVTTICRAKGLDATVNQESVHSSRRPEANLTAGDYAHQEAEISRLTWAVLDGKATDTERRRLAKLVTLQHDRRRAQA